MFWKASSIKSKMGLTQQLHPQALREALQRSTGRQGQEGALHLGNCKSQSKTENSLNNPPQGDG